MRNMRWRTVTVLATLLVVMAWPDGASAATRYLDPMFEDVTITEDVVYGSATSSLGELQQLKLDVYQPAGDAETLRPLYIWAHGSAFTNMDVNKRNSRGPVVEYTKSGWVTASIDYRKRPNLPCCATDYITDPGALENGVSAARDAAHDMQAAVRYLRANAATYGVDPDKIAVGGMSAGAIVSLMTVFNYDDPGDSGTPGISSRVAAGISHSGSYLHVLQGTGIRPGDPPIAIFHGLNDFEVPQVAAITPCLLTRAMLNVCEFALYSDRGHETLGTREAQRFLYRQVAG